MKLLAGPYTTYVNEKGNKVVINRAEITEFTSYKAIEQIKESFNQLTETEKDFVFALEAQFNGFGFTVTACDQRKVISVDVRKQTT